jgi:hypothetical protein
MLWMDAGCQPRPSIFYITKLSKNQVGAVRLIAKKFLFLDRLDCFDGVFDFPQLENRPAEQQGNYNQ